MLAPSETADTILGTRFLIFPQAPHVAGYSTPEAVWLSVDPSSLQAGPADDRMYVRDPVDGKDPYEFPYLPPFVGLANPPAAAGPDGHFDQIPITSRQFVAAHAFASVRRVLDIWESYLGRRIVWHFSETYERLEIIPWLDWNNAQSGYGFLELGVEHTDDGQVSPYALNFDTIAHEVGHTIVFSLLGMPEDTFFTPDFGAFHEAYSDLVSLITFMHFDSGLDRLLRRCQGNLLTLNELNRIVELTGERQIRLASNGRRMSEVSGEVHDRSRPFTGAIFDTIVETYHSILVEEELADERLLRVDLRDFDDRTLSDVSTFTASAFRSRPVQFKSALTRARDEVGLLMAHTLDRLDPDNLVFGSVADAMLGLAEEKDNALASRLDVNFRWREFY